MVIVMKSLVIFHKFSRSSIINKYGLYLLYTSSELLPKNLKTPSDRNATKDVYCASLLE